MPRKQKVVIFHGSFCTPEMMYLFARVLISLGWYDVIIPDLYRDRQEPYLYNYLQNAILAVEEERRSSDDPVIIIGYSMGGLIAQKVAEMLGPKVVGKVVLMCSVPPRGIPLLNWNILRVLPKYAFDILGDRTFEPTWSDAEKFFFGFIPGEQRHKLYEEMRGEKGFAALQMLTISMAVKADAIECPILHVIARDDKFVPPSIGKKIADYYEGNVRVFPRHGHFLPFEPGREVVAYAIHKWLGTE